MKNLRQLLRRSGLLSSEKRRGRSENTGRNNVSRRRLNNEALEKRELLAGDILASNHNYWNGYDVNDDHQITARDALAVINYLSNQDNAAAGELPSQEGQARMFYDVNADHRISAADALGVINALGRAEGQGELVEFLLTARTVDDQPITPQPDGSISIGVNEPFFLEVAYNDLRLFNDKLGVFQLRADIGVSEGDALEPILNETQRLIIGGDALSRNDVSSFTGDFIFSIPGGTTYESDFLDFAQNSRGEIANALAAFGYSSDEYDLSSLDFGNDDIGFQIFFKDAAFRDTNLPDISVSSNIVDGSNAAVSFPTQTIVFNPRNPDGSINTDAVRFNVNSFSRTFNNNEKFYAAQNRGEFDPAAGFTSFGGLGLVPPQGGGVPQLTDDGGFITPFDAVSVLVQFTKPVSNFMADVNPGEGDEDTLLYGRDDALPQSLVLIDDDAVVTFNVTGTVNPPVAGDTQLAVTEDIANTVDLSTLLTGGAFDTLAVTTNGSRGSASISGTTLTYTPSADENGTDTIVYTASNSGGSDTGTIAVNIAAVNDPPVPVNKTVSTTQDTALTIQLSALLAGASTGAANEADTLTVNSVGAPNQANASTSLNGTVVYTPAPGFTGVDTFTYTIGDGTDEGTATVTVNVGVTPAPVAGDGNLAVTEDISNSIDLATLLSGGAVDSLTVSTDGSRGSATLSGTTLTYVPDPDENGSDTVVYTATNTGGSDTGTISITIAAVNDPPVADNDSFTADQNTPLTIQLADLLDGDTTGAANEADTLSVIAVSDPANSNASTSLNGTVVYTPAPGFTGTDTFTYTLSDGTDTDTATVTITVNEIAPIAGDGNLTVSQNSSGTLDLSTLLSGGTPDSLVITTDPATGSASISGNILTYNSAGAGNDSLVYTASNSTGSDTGTISITITEVNQPPTAPPLSVSFSEQDAAATVDLLQNVSDPDTSDTISIASGPVFVSGDPTGITVSGSTISVNPGALGSLVDGESSSAVYSYSVTDNVNSPVDTSVTITINGFNDPPQARDDNGLVAFVDITQDLTVISNDDAGQDESGQSFSVVSVVSDDGNATVSVNNDNTIAFTPDPGFTGPTSFTYTIRDAQGKEDSATASVTVQDFNPSSIGGSIFIDHVENLRAVIDQNAAPLRNGVHDSDEPGVGGLMINLFSPASDNVTGEAISIDTWTNSHGAYDFTGVAPGSYTVMPLVDGLPLTDTDKVLYIGAGEFQVDIGTTGGEDVNGLNFPLLGTSGNALNTVDILASSYLRTHPQINSISDEGREGGLVSLSSSGSQNFIILGAGFEGVDFAEFVLNGDRDAALLTIVEENVVRTARLSADEFILANGNGLGVQFFGGIDDFDFFSASNDVSNEFPDYLDTIAAARDAGVINTDQ